MKIKIGSTSTLCLTALSLFILLLTPSKQVSAQQRSVYDLAAWIIAAVPYYDTTSVNWALKEGGQIDFKRAGMNALEMAMYYKKTEMIKFLLQKGASIDSVNQDGMNALQYAEKIGSPEIIQLIKAEMNVTPTLPTDNPKPVVLHEEKKPETVSSNTQQRSVYDLAAWIIAAVYYYDTTSVNWALKEGGQIDFKRNGMNALEEAMYLKKIEMMKFLLQKGASIDSVNQDGMNALQYAEKIGNQEIIQLIKKEMKITAPVHSDTAKNNTVKDEKKPALPPVTNLPVVVNAYKVGDKVLISRTRGKSWEPGTIKEISTDPGVSEDGTPEYMVENMAKTAQQYVDLNFITTLTRQPTWTSFFIGDWDLHAPIAAVDRVIERDVYTIISGGDRFPPIRINANGTYSWVIDKNKIIKGKWIQNENVPGILLLKGYRGVNWSVYNSSDKNNRKIFKKDYIIITDEKGYYLSNHGFRIK